MTGAAWNCTSGASSPGRVRKKPPASPMFDVSGPRPSLCKSPTFSGVSALIRVSVSVYQLISVIGWSCRPTPTGRSSRTGTCKGDGNMDLLRAVRAAGLDQRHMGRGVFREAGGKHAAGRAGADDDVVGHEVSSQGCRALLFDALRE